MVLSKYNFYKDAPNQEGGYIYNACTGSILNIADPADWKGLQNNSFETLDEETTQMLKDNGVIVESHQAEFEGIKSRSYAAVNNNEALYITLMPTDSCNFACPYCFIYDKAANFMTDSIFQDVLNYIEEKLVEKKELKYLNLNWFGGEPSLCHDKIIVFMKKLKDVCKDYSVQINGAMTTNGYLVDGKRFKELVDSGVVHVQFTIDGAKETHDKFRSLKNGQGTYDKIFSNLQEITKLPSDVDFRLDVRCNFTKATLDSVRNFVKIFVANFNDDKRFKVYCRPVYHYETKDNEIEAIESDLFSLDEGIEVQNTIAMLLRDMDRDDYARRMFDPLPQPTNCWCNAEYKNNMIVGALGEMYVCDTLTGKEYAMGYVGKDDPNGEKQLRYDIFADDRTKKCMDCKLLPLCMGGCLRNRIHSEAQCYWNISRIEKSLDEYIANVFKEDEAS